MTARTGTWWDTVAVLALLAPLAGVLAPLTGPVARRSMVATGRVGALVAGALWVVVLAAGAAPELGAFAPDALAAAAAAGAALLAAAAATGHQSAGPVLAPPAAALVGLGVGLVDRPTSLSSGTAAALVAVGAVVAAVSPTLTGRARITSVAMPMGLLVGLRGAQALADPSALLAMVAAVAALAAAASALRSPNGSRVTPPPAAVLGVTALALAVAPVEAARPAGALLAAAAVLAAAAWATSWPLLAALPAAALAAQALADVPVPDPPNPVVHAAFAVLLGAVATLVVLVSQRRPSDDGDRAPEVRAAVVALGGWLLLAPGSWRWAVPDRDALAPWDRAAAVGLAAALLVVAVGLVGDPRDRLVRRARR